MFQKNFFTTAIFCMVIMAVANTDASAREQTARIAPDVVEHAYCLLTQQSSWCKFSTKISGRNYTKRRNFLISGTYSEIAEKGDSLYILTEGEAKLLCNMKEPRICAPILKEEVEEIAISMGSVKHFSCLENGPDAKKCMITTSGDRTFLVDTANASIAKDGLVLFFVYWGPIQKNTERSLCTKKRDACAVIITEIEWQFRTNQ